MKESAVNKLINKFLDSQLNRREFIALFLKAGGFVSISSSLACFYKLSNKTSPLNLSQEKTLSKVQEHLFPSTGDSPGATDINALSYLHFVLSDPSIDDRDKRLIINGTNWLESFVDHKKKKPFKNLNFKEREDILQEINQELWGEDWLSSLLKYIMEALLSDPIYGSNPEGIGWKWLEHEPGLPRPDKKYSYEL